MVERLLISGLIIIPFYELLVKLLPFAITTTGDTREAKSFLVLFFAVACFFISQNLKHVSKFIPILIAYIFFTHHLWYKMPLIMNDVTIDGFYRWKPMLQILAFYGLFIAVASSQINVNRVMKFYMWSAFAMAVYVLFQTLGLDQFFTMIEAIYTNSIGDARRRVGNLGQPTLVAPFIAAAIPSTIYFRKYWASVILAFSVLLTKSDVALAVMIAGFIFYLFHVNRKLMYAVIIFAEIVVLIGFSSNLKIPCFSGREMVWPETVQDIRTTPFVKDDGKRFAFTGVGLGTYPLTFHVKHEHQTKFLQAHNEYLEWLYSTGIVGLLLLSACIYEIFSIRGNILLTSTFLMLALFAAGTFIWQLGIYQFLTTIIVGLIYGGKNEKIFNNA